MTRCILALFLVACGVSKETTESNTLTAARYGAELQVCARLEPRAAADDCACSVAKEFGRSCAFLDAGAARSAWVSALLDGGPDAR